MGPSVERALMGENRQLVMIIALRAAISDPTTDSSLRAYTLENR